MIQAVSLHGKRHTNYCRPWQAIFKWFEYIFQLIDLYTLSLLYKEYNIKTASNVIRKKEIRTPKSILLLSLQLNPSYQ